MAPRSTTPPKEPKEPKAPRGTDATPDTIAATAGDVFGYDAGTTATVTPLPARDTPPVDTDDDGPTTWTPVDLGPALDGDDTPPPTVLARTDGLRLLYSGKTHAFIGESESCKTWGAALAAAEVLATPDGLVLWVDYEDDAAGLVNRLRAMGVDRDAIAHRLHYVHPEEPIQVGDKYTRAGVEFLTLIRDNAYTVAIIDGVTEAMTTEGLDPLGTNDAAIWARRLPKRIATTGAMPAVVVIDHVPKGNGDGPRRFALGSQHKISGLTGAAFMFEVRRTLHRATTEPVEAEIVVKVGKDRPGHVRAGATGFDQVKPIAVMHLTAYPDGGVTGRLVPPDEVSTAPPRALLEAIAGELKYTPGMTGRTMCEAIGGKAETVRAALKYMVTAGLVTVEKVGRSHLHTLTDAGITELIEA